MKNKLDESFWIHMTNFYIKEFRKLLSFNVNNWILPMIVHIYLYKNLNFSSFYFEAAWISPHTLHPSVRPSIRPSIRWFTVLPWSASFTFLSNKYQNHTISEITSYMWLFIKKGIFTRQKGKPSVSFLAMNNLQLFHLKKIFVIRYRITSIKV